MASQELTIVDNDGKKALADISEKFEVVETVKQLRSMMNRVTDKEINPDTVNAACNCAQNINLTIKTAIQAARFLRDGK